MKKLLGLLYCISSITLSAETVSLYVGTSSSEGAWYADLDTETCELGELRLAVKQNSPSFLAMGANGDFWYSTAKDPSQKRKDQARVASYKRDSKSGELVFVNSQSSVGANPCHISLDRTETCLFVANYGGGGVTSYKLSAEGDIGAPVSAIQHEGSSIHPKRQKSPHAHSVYASVDNKFLYACDLGMDEVLTYKLDAETAELSPAGTTKITPGSGPRHMDFSHDGSRAFLLNELSMSVDVFDCDAQTGSMEKLGSYPVLAEPEEEMSCSEVRVSDDGRFLYTANRDLAGKNRDSISVFRITEGGSLEPVQVAPAKVWIPRHFDITPDGKCLVIAGQRANALSILKRDIETGMLTSVSQVSEVKSPMWIGFIKK